MSTNVLMQLKKASKLSNRETEAEGEQRRRWAERSQGQR